MLKRGSVVLLLILSLFVAQAQVGSLKVDKKHEINVTHCTDNGNIEIPPRYIEEHDSLYFILETKGDWTFSKGDVKDLKSILFKQEDGNTEMGRIHGRYNGGNKIAQILIVYPREKINLTKRFQLEYEGNLSNVMDIPEKHWPKYVEFNDFFNKGKNLNDNGQYIAAYQQLEYFLPGSEYYMEFDLFSQHNYIEDNLIPEVIENYQNLVSNELNEARTKFDATEEISMEELNTFGLKKDSVILTNTLFDAYYRISEPMNNDLHEKHLNLMKDYEAYYENMYSKWKTTVLGVIETGFYQKENKYEVFIELLARLLIYTNRVDILSEYDSINTTLISDPTVQIAFFQNHIEILDMMQWKKEFIIVLQLLNENIRTKKEILGTTHMMNLRTNERTEQQPNFRIISAFNDLVKGNFELFEGNIEKAIARSTNKEIIYYLELWNFSYRLRLKSAKQEFVDKINAGMDYEAKMLPKDAIQQYTMASRIDSKNALPSFLTGRIMLEVQHEKYASERFFKEAINLYPQFALARIYHLEILMEDNQTKEALNQIQAISNYSSLQIWYIYYIKARLLMMEAQYAQALKVVENECIPIKAKSFDQFILLGEIYMNMKNCAKAKENFESAGEMEPTNPIYSEKMAIFRQNCNN